MSPQLIDWRIKLCHKAAQRSFRTLFSELSTLSGAAGARQMIKKYTLEATAIPFPEGAIDLDTPLDYQRLKELGGAETGDTRSRDALL